MSAIKAMERKDVKTTTDCLLRLDNIVSILCEQMLSTLCKYSFPIISAFANFRMFIRIFADNLRF